LSRWVHAVLVGLFDTVGLLWILLWKAQRFFGLFGGSTGDWIVKSESNERWITYLRDPPWLSLIWLFCSGFRLSFLLLMLSFLEAKDLLTLSGAGLPLANCCFPFGCLSTKPFITLMIWIKKESETILQVYLELTLELLRLSSTAQPFCRTKHQ